MKKLIAGSLCAAMIVSSASGVAAAEATDAYSLNYGFSMTSAGESVQEDITVVTNGEAATASVKVTSDETTIELPQYMLATTDGVFINAESILNAAKNMEGVPEGIEGYASLFGITDKWVKLAPIDLGALEFKENPFDVEIPEFDEDMQNELTAIITGLVKIEETENGEECYIIDNETVGATATAIDDFKNAHLGFVGDILTYIQDVLVGSSEVDLKPAIRNYLDAFAEGYMAADSEVSEEDAKAAVDGMFDSIMAEGIPQITEAIQEVPVADLWNDFSVKEIVDNAVAETPFEVKVVVGDTGISYEVTIDGETIHGTIEQDGDKFVVTIYDSQDVLYGTMEITSDENGSESVVKDADGNIVVSCKMEVIENGDDLNVTYDLVSSEEDVELHGYLNKTAWVDDGSLDTPESANDILDIIKTVSTMLFLSTESAE